MTTLTITHTHAEGTLIDGTTRGDGSAEVLKANRWRWSRNLGSWYIPHSRDHNAKDWQIRMTAEQLREAGFEVEVDVDDTARPTADVQADRTARAADRAVALDHKAQRLQATSDRHRATVDQISSGIPFGQPILVGHHSETRARRDAARIHSNMGAAIEAGQAARETERRAEAARTNTRPEHPTTTANRLDRLRAELRQVERRLNGSTSLQAEQLREQITYWEQVRAQQIADGRTVDTSTARAGDFVQVHRSGWWRIKRVNPKTFTVTSGHSQVRIAHHQVTALRAADAAQSAD